MTAKEIQDIINLAFENRGVNIRIPDIADKIKEYTKLKCREQRWLCKMEYRKHTVPQKTYIEEIDKDIREAPEPKFE